MSALAKLAKLTLVVARNGGAPRALQASVRVRDDVLPVQRSHERSVRRARARAAVALEASDRIGWRRQPHHGRIAESLVVTEVEPSLGHISQSVSQSVSQ